KRGLGLDKYIREGELGIDDSKVSIFHTDSDDLEWQPIYNSKTVSAGEPNPLYAGQPNPVSAGNKEADQLGLAFPSLNLIFGVGSALIGYSVSTDSTPPISAGSTPLISLCASPISVDRHFISVGKCHVSAGKPTGSAGIPVSAGRPSGSVAR
nr:hypothetical protein [Tanacetum cinerariifolium]